MKWYCKQCKNVMESKTALSKVTGKRYTVDCDCTESMTSDRKAEAFQDKNWKRL